MNKWTPSDWIVFLLSIGVIVFLIVLAIKTATSTESETQQGRVDILKNILSYIIGIISAYVLSKKESK